MTVQEFLQSSTLMLEKTGVATARLDCLVLLEDTTGKDRSYLLAHPDLTLQEASLHNLNGQIKRRVRHEPLAYIRCKTEFYGRDFIINKHVLEPRPESETIIDLLLKQTVNGLEVTGYKKLNVLDLGTGSGALGITAKLESPKINVVCTDIDENCLKLAHKNAKRHNVDIKFVKSDLFSNLQPTTCGLILANLPYVPDSFKLNEAAKHEPKLAIFGGPDGLDVYRNMFEQLSSFKIYPTYILTESLPSQHKKLAIIADAAGYKLAITRDFIQLYIAI